MFGSVLFFYHHHHRQQQNNNNSRGCTTTIAVEVAGLGGVDSASKSEKPEGQIEIQNTRLAPSHNRQRPGTALKDWGSGQRAQEPRGPGTSPSQAFFGLGKEGATSHGSQGLLTASAQGCFG